MSYLQEQEEDQDHLIKQQDHHLLINFLKTRKILDQVITKTHQSLAHTEMLNIIRL